jgi:hypothetical protein
MVLHCMALLLLFHSFSHFHLYIVDIYSGVVTLVRLLDPENGGIMLGPDVHYCLPVDLA